MKSKKFNKTLESNIKQNKVHSYLNNLENKGKLWLDGIQISESKVIKPTINGDLDNTEKIWFENLKSK